MIAARNVRACTPGRIAIVASTWLLLALWIGVSIPRTFAADADAARVLDDFSDVSAWKAVASDGVSASVGASTDAQGPALRLEFDLAGTAGYASAHRALPLTLPENFELSFDMRAESPVNDLQIKLIDASGENVWWFHRRNFEFSREWRRIRIKKRQIEFAWGPTPDHRLTQIASVELVISAGRGGGQGVVYLRQLELHPLPPDPPVWPIPVVTASSSFEGTTPALALDGNRATAWESDPATGPEQSLTLDFGGTRPFGGMVLRWLDAAYPTRYEVELSDDGKQWRTALSITSGHGGFDAVPLAEGDARFVRIAMHRGPEPQYGLAEIEIKPPDFGESGNAFFSAIAPEFPRGSFPRGFSGEQSWWTLVGIDGGHESALMSEDGALEVAPGGFSIEPFIVDDARVVTWADVESRQSLSENYLPIPTVTWRRPDWELRTTAFASGTSSTSLLLARYDVRNLTTRRIELTLALALRPFQVNPPTQFLATPGGVSSIHQIAWDGKAFTVNGDRKVYALVPPNEARALPYEAGPPTQFLASPDKRVVRQVHDRAGYASGVLLYRLTLAPRATTTIGLSVPLTGTSSHPALGRMSPARWLAKEQDAVAAGWRAKLNRVAIRVPAASQPIVDTLRTALAHILITREGAILRPGTRSYARSWIRDGAMMSDSLARLGHSDAARAYLTWYASQLFASGKVPCCVDERGADPVPENDSPGEFLFLAATVYRYSKDAALLQQIWPQLSGALDYMERLRQSERTSANRVDERSAFYGLMPASISHEGYSDKPVHSYWDDFWALKGYNAAIELARALDQPDVARTTTQHRDEFRRDLIASLNATITSHALAYLPGSAELGDFDPTSTTIALAPDGDRDVLPKSVLFQTYERYWREFVARRDGHGAWRDYTPYELRNARVYVRLGWPRRAQDLIAYFLGGRRPQAWNQWPEVVDRESRKARFIGDLPHGWVASDFISAALDLFAFYREADRALVLAAGVPTEWLEGEGIQVKGLATRYGPLSYALRNQEGAMLLQIGADSRLPPGGFVLAWPGRKPPGATTVNGKPVDWIDNQLRIREVPAEVAIATR
ncbi:MAG TPA: discoidin domain-containing protein [Casimicrobiaceae bacterium]|nr:discoidin domain-containing protein [Casimicrobiaceae bacterium]